MRTLLGWGIALIVVLVVAIGVWQFCDLPLVTRRAPVELLAHIKLGDAVTSAKEQEFNELVDAANQQIDSMKGSIKSYESLQWWSSLLASIVIPALIMFGGMFGVQQFRTPETVLAEIAAGIVAFLGVLQFTAGTTDSFAAKNINELREKQFALHGKCVDAAALMQNAGTIEEAKGIIADLKFHLDPAD